MFQLREEHEKALASVALENFEDRAVVHIRKNLPRQAAGLTEEDLRSRIRRESERSRTFGLKSEQQIMRFVDANFVLGEKYLDDPGNQWAHQILQEKTGADERAIKLLDNAVKHSAEVKNP